MDTKKLNELLDKAYKIREPHRAIRAADSVLEGINQIRKLVPEGKIEEARVIADDIYGFCNAMTYNVNLSGYYYLELTDVLKEVKDILSSHEH